MPTSPEIRASTTLGNSKCQTDRVVNAIIYMYFNESVNNDKHDWQLLSLKIVKRVVSHIIFASYARNVRFQKFHCESKHADAGVTRQQHVQ